MPLIKAGKKFSEIKIRKKIKIETSFKKDADPIQ